MRFWSAVGAVCVLVLALLVGSALASTHGGEVSQWTMGATGKFTWRIINSIVLLIVLVYLLKKPLMTYFVERKAQIKKDLAEAQQAKERAEQTIKEYEAKMAGMEQELEKMRQELQKSAAAESEKVIENADRMAAAVVESAKIAAEQEVRKARTILQNEAAELAMNMAEALIREKIKPEDQKRIITDYLAKVGG